MRPSYSKPERKSKAETRVRDFENFALTELKLLLISEILSICKQICGRADFKTLQLK